MPDDRCPQWAAEQAGTNRLPSAGATLLLFAVVTLALLVLLGPTAAALAENANRGKPPTLCQEHKGRPGWDAICAETARRR